MWFQNQSKPFASSVSTEARARQQNVFVINNRTFSAVTVAPWHVSHKYVKRCSKKISKKVIYTVFEDVRMYRKHWCNLVKCVLSLRSTTYNAAVLHTNALIFHATQFSTYIHRGALKNRSIAKVTIIIYWWCSW